VVAPLLAGRRTLRSSFLLHRSMKSATNIHFHKNGQTRFVKHGFSWQLFFFGPLALLMRGQWPLALLCAGFLFATYLIVGLAILLVLNPAEDWVAQTWAILIACGLVGHFGNRISARSYVKKGWAPVADFPADWNTPQLIAPKAAETTSG